jgi:dTDP-4-dehydrorhamnose reductase
LRILLTGRNGQVGWELERQLPSLGEVIATDRSTLDLADPDAIRRAVREAKPDVIVNAAAYTAVDKAESEPELAVAINARAPEIFAEEAKRTGALLVHFSTDYVFDGLKRAPYAEDDLPNPLSVYGRSKLEGERCILSSGCRTLVLRTSWVYAPRARNFLLAIARKVAAGEPLRVVNDQRGVPNSASFLAASTARVLRRLVEAPLPLPLYHLSAVGSATWHDFAVRIVARLKPGTPVAAVSTRDYGLLAARPAYAVLDAARLSSDAQLVMPSWEELVEECMDTYTYPHLRTP